MLPKPDHFYNSPIHTGNYEAQRSDNDVILASALHSQMSKCNTFISSHDNSYSRLMEQVSYITLEIFYVP